MAADGSEIRPFDDDDAVAAARWFRARQIDTIGVCFIHAYANPGHEERMLEILHREHPAATVSVSSQVLREYREYERSVTTLVDAAVKPNIRRYVTRIAKRLDDYAHHHVPFYVMKSMAACCRPRRSSTSRSQRCCPDRLPARSGLRSSRNAPASTASSPSTAAARRPT